MARIVGNTRTRVAKAVAKKNRANQPRKKPKKKPPSKYRRITKAMMRKAIKGSWGVKSTIAEQLGCCQSTVTYVLDRPGWEELLMLYNEEKEALVDKAENVIVSAMDDKNEPSIASQNARFVLERQGKERGWGREGKLVLEGGDKPIGIEGSVGVDTLDLSTAVKRKLLAAMDAAEATQQGEMTDG